MWPTQAQILYAQKPLPLALYTTPYGLAGCIAAPIAGLLFYPEKARWILIACCSGLFIVSSAQAVVGMFDISVVKLFPSCSHL